MIQQTKALKKLGYNIAVKAYHDEEGFIAMVWIPGQAKFNTETVKGDNPTELLRLIIKRIKESK